VDPRDLARFRAGESASTRRKIQAISGSSLFFSGALLIGFEIGPWYLFDASVPGLIAMVWGAWHLIKAHRG